MQSLDDIFRSLNTQCKDWSDYDIHRMLATLQSVAPSATIDWEDFENWGMVVMQREAVAYVSARWPLAFVQAELLDTLSQRDVDSRVLIVPFKDVHEPRFRVDKSLLEQLLRRELTDVVDYDSLSASDLWYATL